MNLLTVDTIEQARKKIRNYTASWIRKTEIIPLDDVINTAGAGIRVLAEDIYAGSDIPGFRRATVDGYAVLAADTAAAGETIPVFLKQTGTVSMGKPAGFSIKSGECAYVPTGGMLPDGADAMVMIEYCEAVAGNIAIYEAAAAGSGMAISGEDRKKGELLLRRGSLVRPQEAGALSAAGIINVPVFFPVKMSIISTGDELVSPDKEPLPGEIRDINTHALKALALRRGYQVLACKVLPDSKEQVETAVREAMISSNLVIISGGSSQGEKDMTAGIIDSAAKPGVFTHGLAVKPGKPTILGWDEESKTLLAGLPGHPVSAMLVFELLLGDINIGTGERGLGTREQGVGNGDWGLGNRVFPVPARLSSNIPGSPGKTVCQPVILSYRENFCYAEPVFGKSGMITTLTRADGYIIIDLNKEGLNRDEQVLVHLF